jgi:hypothetical protein
MKYAEAILVNIVGGVLLDILIDAKIPDRVMNVVFIVVASVVLLDPLSILANHMSVDCLRDGDPSARPNLC